MGLMVNGLHSFISNVIYMCEFEDKYMLIVMVTFCSAVV